MTLSLIDVHAPPTVPKRARVLLVDDEPRVLESLSRGLRRVFDVETATSGFAGLAALKENGPFEVIVSDMRMPGIDGASFLLQSRVHAPDAVRIMLTGYSDIDAAKRAVNDGQIFRFLMKPCPSDAFLATISEAVDHQRIVAAERRLLAETLNGAIQVLADVLAIANPAAFSRAQRLRRTAGDLARALDVPDQWAVDAAAVLSQLGSITLPPKVVHAIHYGEQLDAEAQALVHALPATTERLIGHIPRMEPVIAIVRHANTRFDGNGGAIGGVRGMELPIGARILRLAQDYDVLEAQGFASDVILATLEGRVGAYDPALLGALRELRQVQERSVEVRSMELKDVRVGMVFAADVVTVSGLLLIGRGQEVTQSLGDRIFTYWRDTPLRETPKLFVKTGTLAAAGSA